MEINITNGLQTVITIKGRLDTVNAPTFENAIAPVITGEKKEIVLDCTALDYISSSGLRLFLTLQKHTNTKQGQLTLKGMKDEIKEIFDMTGFSAIFCFS
jgi:anti-sigma B factor antagonist/stage II sporulation protein AA (anti-sigma F factor antagonist)